MEIKKTYKDFRYESEIRWTSGRRAAVNSMGKPQLETSSPPEFKGEAGLWTPEDLFVASINACTMLTFVDLAQRKGLEFVDYESDAEGLLEFVEGKYRFTEVILHPHVGVKSEQDVDRAREIMNDAHAHCFVTSSTTASVKIFPMFRVA